MATAARPRKPQDTCRARHPPAQTLPARPTCATANAFAPMPECRMTRDVVATLDLVRLDYAVVRARNRLHFRL